jgi:hypothetical protein
MALSTTTLTPYYVPLITNNLMVTKVFSVNCKLYNRRPYIVIVQEMNCSLLLLFLAYRHM